MSTSQADVQNILKETVDKQELVTLRKPVEIPLPFVLQKITSRVIIPFAHYPDKCCNIRN
jgi:hypothetical protein